ncbi:MAG TPA: hypothetical protein VGJ11_09655 [Gaiellales bacterium]
MGRLVASVTVLVAALALPAAAAAKPLTQTPLRTNPPPVNEESPSAAPGYFAWVQNSRSHPHLYNLYAQHDGRTRYRVNPAGTQAGLGTGIDGTTLVYTQTHGAKLSIMMFDLQTKHRFAPPAGVNTASIEDEPTISGDWLLFHRPEQGSSPGEQVILRNMHTGETRTIASVRGRVAQVEAGQVNGDWAVFTKSVNGTRFNVWLYQISTKSLTLVPNPRDKVHSAAAVNPFGTVYFEESGSRCGSNATVEVFPIGGPMITAGTLRPGIDMFHPFVFEHASTDSFMFAKLHCAGGATDVFESNFA